MMHLDRTYKISSEENSDEHADTDNGKIQFSRKQDEYIFKNLNQNKLLISAFHCRFVITLVNVVL